MERAEATLAEMMNENRERHWAQSPRPVHCLPNPRAAPQHLAPDCLWLCAFLGASLCKTSVIWEQDPRKCAAICHGGSGDFRKAAGKPAGPAQVAGLGGSRATWFGGGPGRTISAQWTPDSAGHGPVLSPQTLQLVSFPLVLAETSGVAKR